jgi:hypothetical protein
VEDTGIGIKDVDQKKLFKLFGMIANKKLKNIRKMLSKKSLHYKPVKELTSTEKTFEKL